MSDTHKHAVLLSLLVGLLGCGGSLSGQGNNPDAGADVWHSEPACAALPACACLGAGDRCTPRTEACWCPSECSLQIDCICGGGRFLACEDKQVLASCTAQLTAVVAKCAGQAFVQYVGDLCSAATDPSCVAGCLADLNSAGSCAEIDCSFCPVCDCFSAPSTFSSCIAACNAPPPLPQPPLR